MILPLLKTDSDPKLIEILLKHLKKYASEGLRFYFYIFFYIFFLKNVSCCKPRNK
jgi:hypothetical protein